MFPKKNFEGQTYDFDHLTPLRLVIQLGDEPISAKVKFGCHCFTESFDESKHQDHHRYSYKGELRAFDKTRYELSLELPRLIQEELISGKIYKSEDSYTYLAHLPVMVNGVKASTYPVFFAIEKDKSTEKKGVVIFVKSAYLKEDMRFAPNAMSWRFKGLVAEFVGMGAAKGKPRPKKQKGSRRTPLGA